MKVPTNITWVQKREKENKNENGFYLSKGNKVQYDEKLRQKLCERFTQNT